MRLLRGFWRPVRGVVFLLPVVFGACVRFSGSAELADPGDASATAPGNLADDSAGDAAGDSTVSGMRFCDSHRGALHCWDFDSPVLTGQFDGVSMKGGSLEVVDDAARPGNRVLSARLENENGDAAPRSAFAWKRLASEPLRVGYQLSYRFQVRRSVVDSVFLGAFFWSFVPGAGGAFGVASYHRGSTLGTVPDGQQFDAQAGGQWHTAVVKVAPAGPRLGGSIVVDGVKAYDTTDFPPPQGAADFNAYLGVFYPTSGEFEVWFDDILVEQAS